VDGKGAREGGWPASEGPFLKKAGPPIMVRSFTGGRIWELQAQLNNPAGNVLPCRVYPEPDKRITRLEDWPSVLWLPEKQFQTRTRYPATVTRKVNEAPFESKGTFVTRQE
jgi:hypothetical protein